MTPTALNLESSLNKVQIEAAKHIDGPLMVVAGAGSGKTRIITYRIAYLIEQGIFPANILAVTFTNKAAGEMKERIERLCASSSSPMISTFHSFGANLLRREIHHLGYQSNFTIYDEDDSRRLIRQCIEELDLNPDVYNPKSAIYSITKAKNIMRSPDEYEESVIVNYEKMMARIYRLYLKKLKENNALDFDDLIVLAVKLFQEFPQVLEKYQNRYRYILIDEYQDTNSPQYRLIKLLAAKYKNICVVGDPDQSIYQWRGADIENILNFEKDFPGAKVITMEQNYRSPTPILKAANALISHNLDRKEKELWTEISGGEKPVYFRAYSDREEALYVATKIKRAVKQDGFRLQDTAVFFRTNAQSRQFEEAFLKYEIPYVIIGNVGFYARKEIKDILAYLRVLISPAETVSLLRIINLPPRGIGNTTIEKLRRFAAEQELPLYECLKNPEAIDTIGPATKKKVEAFVKLLELLRAEMAKMKPVKFVQILIDRIGYMSLLNKEPPEKKQERQENIEGLISEMAFQTEEGEFSFERFLEHTALWSEIDNLDEKQNRVSLMTMHNAKGLEFPVVFIAGLEEDLLPHSNSKKNTGELEEERRLFYVGITRAQKRLFITSAGCRMKFGQVIPSRKSRFIDEIPPDIIRIERSDRLESRIRPQFGRAPKKRKMKEYWEGMKIRHPTFGLGEILTVEESTNGPLLTVRFYSEPLPKTLAVRFCKLEKV